MVKGGIRPRAYLMFLNRSAPRLPPSPERSTLDPRALNSGIIGGGGPVDFRTVVEGLVFSEETNIRLVRLDSSPSEPLKRRNHPELRLDCLSVAMLALLWLMGLGTKDSPKVGSPLAYKASFSRLRLNKRLMLAGPLDELGEPGTAASAERFRPFLCASGEV